jgi:nitrogen fixation NifU-like protein
MFDLYQEHILDHARHPRHWGLLDPYDYCASDTNPLCGDHLTLTLRVDSQGQITQVGWAGEGCAISQASASLLGERLIGLSVDEARALPMDYVLDLLGIQLMPARLKCAVLSWRVLQASLA